MSALIRSRETQPMAQHRNDQGPEISAGGLMLAASAAVRPGIALDTWLSGILGRPAWQVKSDAPDPASAIAGTLNEPSFFFTRVPAQDVERLRQFEELGFRVVDLTVTLEAATTMQATRTEGVRFAVPADRPAVADIAATSFKWSRLHLDPLIPKKTADRSRAEWASNFFAGKRGDAMVIAENDGAPAAFLLAVGPANGILTIDLIAARPASRRLGLGASCVRFAAREIAGTERLRVATQAANAGSLRFYEGLGFRTVASDYVLHLHRP
jgi:ribosomal protein S18 acetylase RimI-like enzyme